MNKVVVIPVLFLVSLFTLNAQTPSFADFKAQFAAAALPFSLSAEELAAQVENRPAKAKRLAWDYYSFLPELERSAQYSSMPVYPEPVAVFETENNYAFLYNIARGLGKGAKSYAITVYDRYGNYIATNFVAGIDKNTITTVTIDATLLASVKQLDRVSMLQGAQVLDLTAPGNPDQLEWSGIEVAPAATMMVKAEQK